ncbi:hypothetical protein EXN66_Car008250 [Channa argus]|uniref:Uncharacterized protein n=1 Tax=Channa argus TaxID=215402 RepID=A0A6G1PR06_CHAAH|nr:hypothetical protein EXN66_Car008250 [Channa argus]
MLQRTQEKRIYHAMSMLLSCHADIFIKPCDYLLTTLYRTRVSTTCSGILWLPVSRTSPVMPNTDHYLFPSGHSSQPFPTLSSSYSSLLILRIYLHCQDHTPLFPIRAPHLLQTLLVSVTGVQHNLASRRTYYIPILLCQLYYFIIKIIYMQLGRSRLFLFPSSSSWSNGLWG